MIIMLSKTTKSQQCLQSWATLESSLSLTATTPRHLAAKSTTMSKCPWTSSSGSGSVWRNWKVRGSVVHYWFSSKRFYLKGFCQNINKSFILVSINRMDDVIWALVHFFMTFFANSCFVNTVKTWKCFNDIFTELSWTRANSSCIVAWKKFKK